MVGSEENHIKVKAESIQDGDILEGEFWPEPIRVVALKELGSLIQ